MTQKEIKEYNKRCAEFLNEQYEGSFIAHGGTKKMPDYFLELVHSKMKGKSWYIYPKFHSDWNWIMKVLDKIAKIDYGWKVTSKYVNIYSHSGDPRGEFNCVHQINCPKDVKLDTVRTINQFLIWYGLINK